MAETQKKPARTPSRKRGRPAIKADKATIDKALAELEINRPYYTCRVVGSRLEFSLYGGDLVYWPPKTTK